MGGSDTSSVDEDSSDYSSGFEEEEEEGDSINETSSCDTDSDSDETTKKTVKLPSDFTQLPILFNSSSRRKKTIDNYVAPMNMRNKVVRCKEYPFGVYINRYGEVCPNDKRTSRKNKMCGQVENTHISNDEQSEGSTYEYDSDDESSSCLDESPEEMEKEIEREIKRKKRKEEKNFGESSCPEVSHLSKRQKVEVYLSDLNKNSTDEIYDREVLNAKTRKKQAKLINYSNKYLLEWDKTKKKHSGYKMKFKSNLMVSEPSFRMILSKKSDTYIYNLDCSTFEMKCGKCNWCGTSVEGMVAHTAHCT